MDVKNTNRDKDKADSQVLSEQYFINEPVISNRRLDKPMKSSDENLSVAKNDCSNNYFDKSKFSSGEMHFEIKQESIINSKIVQNEIKDFDNPTNTISQLNGQRTKQLLIIVIVAIVFGFINNLINEKSDWTSNILIFSGCIFIGSYFLVHRGKVELGANILLWSLYFTITLLLVTNSGLRDPATIGYAGILVFTALLGNKKQFIILTFTIIFSILSIAVINHFNWIDYSKNPFDWGITFDLILMFAIISYAVWTLAKDLIFALSRLEIENLKANESKEEFQKIAHFDYLTGLPNRMLAEDRFEQSIHQSHRNGKKLAVLFLDLDNFKTVNDSLGHEIGDQLLQHVAKKLANCVQEGDSVCRLGGDEFLIILNELNDDFEISEISNEILMQLVKPILIEEQSLTISCSIGISIYPDNGNDFNGLRQKADMAMYRAKQAGRNTFVFYDEAMNVDMLAHIDRINSLRNAITNKEFVLYYQPKINLRNNKIFSAEALIRWKKADGDLILPDDFIPIAENTGLIIDIGEWVLYEACRQCKEFQNNGLTDFSIAVNLSSIQFRRGDLEVIVIGALKSAGLNAIYLELEVTESLLIEKNRENQQQFNRLQELGVTFTIDDFGTGYSSLSYLKDFNFDFLKIDRSFILKSLTNKDDMILCEAIIGLAHKLNLMVIAEGIETQEQRDTLFSSGCEFAQGNYFSEAISVEQFYQLEELAVIIEKYNNHSERET